MVLQRKVAVVLQWKVAVVATKPIRAAQPVPDDVLVGAATVGAPRERALVGLDGRGVGALAVAPFLAGADPDRNHEASRSSASVGIDLALRSALCLVAPLALLEQDFLSSNNEHLCPPESARSAPPGRLVAALISASCPGVRQVPGVSGGGVLDTSM